MKSIKERVDNGIAWLDITTPNWQEKIDTSKFDITNPYYCVVGQLYGSYRIFDNIFGTTFCLERGFAGDSRSENDLLQKEWESRLVPSWWLNKESVEPGEYKVIDKQIGSIFNIGEIIKVVRPACDILTVEGSAEEILNIVISSNILYINCGIKVIKSV